MGGRPPAGKSLRKGVDGNLGGIRDDPGDRDAFTGGDHIGEDIKELDLRLGERRGVWGENQQLERKFDRKIGQGEVDGAQGENGALFSSDLAGADGRNGFFYAVGLVDQGQGVGVQHHPGDDHRLAGRGYRRLSAEEHDARVDGCDHNGLGHLVGQPQEGQQPGEPGFTSQGVGGGLHGAARERSSLYGSRVQAGSLIQGELGKRRRGKYPPLQQNILPGDDGAVRLADVAQARVEEQHGEHHDA